MSHVFVSYVHEDQEVVNQLANDLRQFGISVWLDREQINPGQRWQNAIRTAIQGGAIFIACFSESYEKKNSSYMNEELTIAVDELRKRPIDSTWFIPVLLTPSSIPDRPINAVESLRAFQWIELFKDWNKGIDKIAETLLSSELALRSSRGVSYVRLARLLSLQRWIDADRETADKILEVMGMSILEVKDLVLLPCEDLKLIDSLWLYYSSGQFGFSVQANIWSSMENQQQLTDLSQDTADKFMARNNEFADIIGWRHDNEWLYKNEKLLLINNLSAPKGHFPGAFVPMSLNLPPKDGKVEKASAGMWWIGFGFDKFFDRVLSCGIGIEPATSFSNEKGAINNDSIEQKAESNIEELRKRLENITL